MKTILKLLLAAAVLSASCRLPVVGISSEVTPGKDGAKLTYVTAVRKAGGVPVILPRVGNEKEARQLLRRVDALIMTGGPDFDPALYGEEILNESVGINASRDTSDLLLIREAVKMGKPVLGICRGMQGINVALGGTLYQDIPTQFPGSNHRQTVPASKATHRVILEKGSRLSALLGGADTIRVNSFHHQAVKDPAPGLKITGWSEDGIPEALEGKKILAVQFHPEGFIFDGQDFFLPVFKKGAIR